MASCQVSSVWQIFAEALFKRHATNQSALFSVRAVWELLSGHDSEALWKHHLFTVLWMRFKVSRGQDQAVSLNCRPESGHPLFLFCLQQRWQPGPSLVVCGHTFQKNPQNTIAVAVPLQEKSVFSFTEIEKEVFSFSSHLLFSHCSDRRWISARLTCHSFPDEMRLFQQRLSYQDWL